MSSRVKRHAAFLLLMQQTNPKQRKLLIQSTTNEQLHALFEVMHNIIYGNIPLEKAYIKSLSRYEAHFLNLIDKKVSLKQRREKLLQYRNQVAKLMKAFANITEWHEK